MDTLDNLKRVCKVFEEEANRRGLKGVLGVASFDPVQSTLLKIQQERLRELCGDTLEILCEKGSMISIAYAYPDYAIDAIAVKEGDIYDKETWNIYARWYPRLNDALNATVEKLAEEADGIPIPATITGEAVNVNHVEEYYGMVLSHRVVAEHAGIGWRGKNELVINPRYSCAIRLASVATPLPLEPTTAQYTGCGDCRSCLNECSFLRNKDTLENYREHCRRYMLGLGLEDFVCGICIKACVNSPVFNTPREMITRKPENPIYYIN